MKWSKRALNAATAVSHDTERALAALREGSTDAIAEVVERFHRPVLAELARRGTPFRGALYAGLMLTDAGPVLLEFNARFGDPECEALLARLDSSLLDLLDAGPGTHSWSIPESLAAIAREGSGVIVLLNCAQTDDALEARLAALIWDAIEKKRK